MANFNKYLQNCLNDLHTQKFYKESNEFKKAIFDTYFREAIEDAYYAGYLDAYKHMQNDRILNFKK